MKIKISDFDLVEMLANFDCQKVIDILEENYLRCAQDLKLMNLHGRLHHNCSFEELHLEWLERFIEDIPFSYIQKKAPEFRKFYQQNLIDSQLEILGFNLEHKLIIGNALRILRTEKFEDLPIHELEDLAINTGLISRCRRCDFGHFTTDRFFQNLSFEGCSATPNGINSPVTGDCVYFVTRGINDESATS
ncbi:hypothetical protein [Idiomarina loihiensis]|uniref:Uncharacterized protein n=1 Tax=Idiomarina loihiensis (strain ATCC BAA-735 / DSM 15497 / L2-TR) TaxID=283942 RepID=Q5R0D0_IDILO|nr:hypothetical protein [Idiomarina loihiensis]AAV81521.1 Hypothetical protein IL0680 [Idiomarina loihiensis L2TR]AGM35549.1 hypothetical protein K734_03410 [Idiomarina loihiensis GSL 199]